MSRLYLLLIRESSFLLLEKVLMKKFNLRAVAVAAAALSASAGSMAIQIGDGQTTTALVYAQERFGASALPVTIAPSAAGIVLDAPQDWTQTKGLATYLRLDLSSNATFGAALNSSTSVTAIGFSSANVALAATTCSYAGGGQVSQSFVVFKCDTPTASASFKTTSSFSFSLRTAETLVVSDASPVTARFRFFDDSGEAANEITPIKAHSAKTIITYASAITVSDATNGALIADVAASAGTFKGFTAATGSTTHVALATINSTFVTGRLGNDSAAITAAGTILAATNSVTVTGDFSWLKGASEAYSDDAVKARIHLRSDDNSCDVASSIAATTKTVSATQVTFTGVAAASVASNMLVCVEPSASMTIPAGSYTYGITYVEQTNYSESDLSAQTLGAITRNGTELLAPFATIHPNYVGRLVLTSTHPTDAQVVVSASYVNSNGTSSSCTGESGTTFTMKANAVTIIPTGSICSAISGANTRLMSLRVTADVPTAKVDGVYQQYNTSSAITGQTSGENTQYTLIRPGQN